MVQNRADEIVEYPRREPEIIPPGRDPSGASRRGRPADSVWVRFEGRSGGPRVFIARGGWVSLALGALAIAFVIAVLITLIASLLLVWLPLVIAVVAVAIGAGALRSRWNRLRGWWSGRR